MVEIIVILVFFVSLLYVTYRLGIETEKKKVSREKVIDAIKDKKIKAAPRKRGSKLTGRL